MFWVSWLPLLWSPKLQGSVTSCPCPMGWQHFGNTPGTLGSQGFSLQPPDPRSLRPHKWDIAPPSGSSCRTMPTPTPAHHLLPAGSGRTKPPLLWAVFQIMACCFQRPRSWDVLGPRQNNGRSPLIQASPFLGRILALLSPLALSSSSLEAWVGQIPS